MLGASKVNGRLPRVTLLGSCRHHSIFQLSTVILLLTVVYIFQGTSIWESTLVLYRRNPIHSLLTRKNSFSSPDGAVSEGIDNPPGRRSQPGRVQVLEPHMHNCRGTFVVAPKYKSAPLKNGTAVSENDAKPPALMLREAVVDQRHNSLAEYRSSHQLDDETPFRRITFHISAARGSKPVHPQPTSGEDLDISNIPMVSITNAKGWKAAVDYILEDAPCRNPCFQVAHKPSLCSGHEWQVVLSLQGPQHFRTERLMDEALDHLGSRSESRLEVHLPVILPNQTNPTKTKLSLALGCVTGLTHQTSLSSRLQDIPPRSSSCGKSSGSIVVSGGAMFGRKRNSLWARKEAAHFAARGLLGTLRFDTVAVGVIAQHSVSEMQASCSASNTTCFKSFQDRNANFMATVATTLEEELASLGVPRTLWGRVVLFPLCNLGTDYAGFEGDGEGCKWSAFYGQWLSNDVSHTLFSPYYRWYASFDLDEFVGRDDEFLNSSKRPPSIKPQKASVKFDELDRSSETGFIILPWLDFKMPSSERRNLTLDFMQHGGLNMMHMTDGITGNLDRSLCKQKGGVGSGGKPIVSCNHGGIGVHVHVPMRLKDPTDLQSRQCSGRDWRFGQELTLYHARGGPRFGKCEYAPQGILKNPQKSVNK